MSKWLGLEPYDRCIPWRDGTNWDEGAEAAWERSAPEVNGQTHHWRHEGEPLNPYRQVLGKGTNKTRRKQ